MRKFTTFNALPKLSLVLSLALITGFVQNSDAQEVITIQEAIEKTLTNNLQVKQSKYSESLSDENLKQSKNALLPTLNGNGSYNINFGRSVDPSTNSFNSSQFSSLNAGLSAGVNVFQGFQKINQIKQNKLLLSADQTNTEKIKNDLVLQVVTSYLQILYNKDLLKAAKEQQTVAKKQLDREQQLLDVGNKTLADLSQAKSQLATADLTVTNAVNALSISYLTLAQLMDVPSATQYEVQAPLSNLTLPAAANGNAEEIYDSSMKLFPDIKLAGLRADAAKRSIEIAKGNYYPTLSFGAGLSTNYSSGREQFVRQELTGTMPIGVVEGSGAIVNAPVFRNITEKYHFKDQFRDNFGQYVGLSLQIPIFNGFQARSTVRKAKITHLQSLADEQLAKNNLNKVIYQAVADLKAAEGRLSATTNTFEAQKDAFHVIEQRYAVGLVNSLDFSTSQSNMNKAEIDMIQAKYDLIFRAKVIDYYLGKQIVF
ncbi:TolC family protein [Pedobacter sp. PLR]|uniref:TolC family protein n=1 Tax=Pedobacter sp. PLR TaxID=2994465 RepID=UPI0022484BB9|nr:TolC family protein [Pedobacter sp. PLR]MCX2450789.1 TolC family protein [Pedobacter sp. PLR]